MVMRKSSREEAGEGLVTVYENGQEDRIQVGRRRWMQRMMT